MLAELQRRGRANRVLAVVPRHILDQVQHELWCRFGSRSCGWTPRHPAPAATNPRRTQPVHVLQPGDRLDRHAQESGRYRPPSRTRPLGRRVIDESHKLVNPGDPQQPARPGARARTPTRSSYLGDPAQRQDGVVRRAGLVARPDGGPRPDVIAHDIGHLVVRRHKHSPDVERRWANKWAERAEPEASRVEATRRPRRRSPTSCRRSGSPGGLCTTTVPDPLFPYTLLKAALSSPAALDETVERRQKTLDARASCTGEGRRSACGPRRRGLRRRLGQARRPRGHVSTRSVSVRAATRAVIFSERIGTLELDREAVRPAAADRGGGPVHHNRKSDEEQQQIVEDFAMAGARTVLVTVTSLPRA